MRPCTRPRARKPTHTHARKHAHTDQYIILIAFPLQKWFRERASMLRYAYVACLVSRTKFCISSDARSSKLRIRVSYRGHS
jgi:hypothetical protein